MTAGHTATAPKRDRVGELWTLDGILLVMVIESTSVSHLDTTFHVMLWLNRKDGTVTRHDVAEYELTSKNAWRQIA